MSLLSEGMDAGLAPAFCAAAASLSGLLTNCETDQDLDDAVKRGQQLMGAKMIDADQLENEVAAVVDEVDRWGSQAESELN